MFQNLFKLIVSSEKLRINFHWLIQYQSKISFSICTCAANTWTFSSMIFHRIQRFGDIIKILSVFIMGSKSWIDVGIGIFEFCTWIFTIQNLVDKDCSDQTTLTIIWKISIFSLKVYCDYHYGNTAPVVKLPSKG